MEFTTSPQLKINEEIIEQNGRRDIGLLLGENVAFKYRQVLDRRGLSYKGPQVFEIEYVSDRGAMPEGFGWWPTAKGLAYLTQPDGEQWIEAPILGERLALKKRYLDSEIANERAALMAANGLFSQDSASRPLRLYGFGVGADNGRIGYSDAYVITELLPPGFASYGEYIGSRNELALDEGLEMALSVAGVVETMHQAGVTHGDLEGTGHEEHIYWNPRSRQLRVIDWSGASVSPEDDNKGIHLDQVGIVQMFDDALRLGGANQGARQLVQQIQHDLGLADPTIYLEAPEGTTRLISDLRVLKDVLLH